jgi:uncharacterized protein
VYHRVLASALRRAADTMPVAAVIGPRQSGKTTLVRHVFPEHKYVSLERPDHRQRAFADPLGFLESLGDRVILDEVQRAPDLLSWIQGSVDEDPSTGRYVLTGSQNLLVMQQVSQSLAGRVAILQLLPLTVAELHDRPSWDPNALDGSPPNGAAPSVGVWEAVWAGFYPRIHDQGLEAGEWLADYRRTYVERDVRDVLRIMDLDAFDRFLCLAAARTGQELNLSELAADVGISQPTAKQWLTALRIGFLLTLLPPHHVTYRKRLRKRPKLHFLDTGLACHLLGIRDPVTLARHPLRGALFESYVVGELVKAFCNVRREAPLFHWRDARGHEVDVLVDLGTKVLPIEAKSGITVPPDAVSALRRWTSLPDNPNEGGVLVHGGTERFNLHGVTVLPWHLT